MKKNDLLDIKALDEKSLRQKVKQTRVELSDLVLDKGMNKLKDVKTISKKRRDLARLLTILRQKELLSELEKGRSR